MSFEFRAPVYSPRWGHPDEYRVICSEEEMTIIGGGSHTCSCRIAENGDPEWVGKLTGRNPLISLFSNDSIYAPFVVPFALEYAWTEWRENRVSDKDLKDALRELFEWIDSTSRAKVKSEFWIGAF